MSLAGWRPGPRLGGSLPCSSFARGEIADDEHFRMTGNGEIGLNGNAPSTIDWDT